MATRNPGVLLAPWRAIARKDYREAKDSRLVRYLVYFFVVVCFLGGYVFPVVTGGDVTTNRFAGFMTESIGLLLPLIGLLLGYNAVVGERTSGQLALSLSMPHDRRDILVGKILGRGVYLLVGVVIGLVGAGALVVYPFGSLSPGWYVAYIALTVLFGLLFFGIGLAISMLTASKHRATVAAFGVYFLFVIVWEPVLDVVMFGLDQFGLVGPQPPNWLLFLHGGEPVLLYERVITGFFEGSSAGPYLGPDAPWYLGEWVALALFAAWIVLPIALGYRRFEMTDL